MKYCEIINLNNWISSTSSYIPNWSLSSTADNRDNILMYYSNRKCSNCLKKKLK